MKVFLSIMLVCGVASCQEYGRAIRLSRPAAARRGDPTRNGPVLPRRDFDLDVARHGAFDNPGKQREHTFNFNERLIKVVQSVQANLTYPVDDEENTPKRDFTKFSYFFYLYLEANTGDYLRDIKEAIGKYLKVGHKPSYVLVGPVRAVFSKFVAAVSRRVAVVQDICLNSPVCRSVLEVKDEEAIAKCSSYDENVKLHDAALENVYSAEQVLQLGLDIGGALKSSQSEDDLRRLVRLEYEVHFKNVKAVYKELQSSEFKCSYQDDNQNDEVNPNIF